MSNFADVMEKIENIAKQHCLVTFRNWNPEKNDYELYIADRGERYIQRYKKNGDETIVGDCYGVSTSCAYDDQLTFCDIQNYAAAHEIYLRSSVGLKADYERAKEKNMPITNLDDVLKNIELIAKEHLEVLRYWNQERTDYALYIADRRGLRIERYRKSGDKTMIIGERYGWTNELRYEDQMAFDEIQGYRVKNNIHLLPSAGLRAGYERIKEKRMNKSKNETKIYLYNGDTPDVLLYDSMDGNTNRAIFNISLNLEVNKAGSMTFDIYPQHPMYSRLVPMKTSITVYKIVDGEEEYLWGGCVCSIDQDMTGRRKITVEGARIAEPVTYKYKGDRDPIAHLLEDPILQDDGIRFKLALNAIYGRRSVESMGIKKVIFNDPATIVLWNDGTKTVVKAHGEAFDKEKGFAMAVIKKMFGNTGKYYELFKKYIKED